MTDHYLYSTTKYLSIPEPNSTLVFSGEIGTSITETITITNSGDATLVIEYPQLLGEDLNDFQIIGDFPVLVNVNDSKIVTVQCTPSETGERKANLKFATNDQNAPSVSYFLECTGIEKPITSPPSVENDDSEIILPTKTFEESEVNLSYHSDNGIANFLGPDWGYAIEQPNPLPDSALAEEATRAFLSVYVSQFTAQCLA